MTLRDQSVSDYLSQVAARTSTPGGGAVAAMVAAEGCSLMAMVAEFTKSDELSELPGNTAKARQALLKLADEDGVAFEGVMSAYRGEGDLEPALAEAARVPAAVIEQCQAQLDGLRALAEYGNSNLASDTAIAALLLKAAVSSSEINIRINVSSMKAAVPDDIRHTLDGIPALTNALDDIAGSIATNL